MGQYGVSYSNGGGGGGGSGTVTSVSVSSAHGVTGTVANATTTPAISLTLGAITPSTIVATSTIAGTNLSGTNTGDQHPDLTEVLGNGSFSQNDVSVGGVVSGGNVILTGDLPIAYIVSANGATPDPSGIYWISSNLSEGTGGLPTYQHITNSDFKLYSNGTTWQIDDTTTASWVNDNANPIAGIWSASSGSATGNPTVDIQAAAQGGNIQLFPGSTIKGFDTGISSFTAPYAPTITISGNGATPDPSDTYVQSGFSGGLPNYVSNIGPGNFRVAFNGTSWQINDGGSNAWDAPAGAILSGLVFSAGGNPGIPSCDAFTDFTINFNAKPVCFDLFVNGPAYAKSDGSANVAFIGTTYRFYAPVTVLSLAIGTTGYGFDSDGTLSALNFSGTSSGTNTGDQNLSGYAALSGAPVFVGSVTADSFVVGVTSYGIDSVGHLAASTGTIQGNFTVSLSTDVVAQTINLSNGQTAHAFEVNSFGNTGGNLFTIDSSGVVLAAGPINLIGGSPGYQVSGTQVVGVQQAAIADANASVSALAVLTTLITAYNDLATKFNTLLAEIRPAGHGLIAN